MNTNDRATLRRWIACAEDLRGYLGESLDSWGDDYLMGRQIARVKHQMARLRVFIYACEMRLKAMEAEPKKVMVTIPIPRGFGVHITAEGK